MGKQFSFQRNIIENIGNQKTEPEIYQNLAIFVVAITNLYKRFGVLSVA